MRFAVLNVAVTVNLYLNINLDTAASVLLVDPFGLAGSLNSLL